MKKYYTIISTSLIFTFSYFYLLLFWSMLTDALLVPWDTIAPEARPALGTLSRTLNDYFEHSYLPLLILTILSVGTCAWRLKKNNFIDVRKILMHNSVLNLLYLAITVIISIVIWILPFGDNRTIQNTSFQPALIILHITLIFSLFYLQMKESIVLKKSKNF